MDNLPKTIDEKVSDLDTILDTFELSCGLPSVGHKDLETEAKRLLESPPEITSKMSSEQCGEAAITLQKFAFFLQKTVNRESSKMKWAEATMLKTISGDILFQKGYGFEERKLAAIKNNDAATKLQNLKIKHELRAERICYLSSKIESLSKAFLELQKSKRGKD